MTRKRRLLIVLLNLMLAALAGWLVAACAANVPPTEFYSPIQPSPSPLLTELPPINWPPSRSIATATPSPVTLPAVYRCACDAERTPTPAPVTPTLTIYDCDGQIAGTHWLTETFGAVTWTSPATATATLTALRASCANAPAVLVAPVEDEAGRPVEGAQVVLTWPGAPDWLPSELYGCPGADGRPTMKGVHGPTNSGGDIGFGLGRGSYYQPPAAGPMDMWLGADSVCLHGLGMLAFTNHHHLDSGWRLLLAGRASPVISADLGFSPVPVYPAVVGGRPMFVIQAGP